jgi:hypothetical protein
MRCVVVALAVAVTLPLAAGQEPAARPKFPPGVPEIVPDPNWEPQAGARATVLVDTRATVPAGGAIKLEKGTPVQVVRYTPPPRASAGRAMSTGEYLAGLQSAGAAGPRPATDAGICVPSGPHEGKEFTVLDTDLGVLIPNPRPWLPSNPGDVLALWDASAPLAADLPTYAALKRDPKSGGRLITRGKAFRLKPGAKVVVLDAYAEGVGRPGFEVSRVRVLPGTLHAGKVGFAFRGNLVPPSMAMAK